MTGEAQTQLPALYIILNRRYISKVKLTETTGTVTIDTTGIFVTV